MKSIYFFLVCLLFVMSVRGQNYNSDNSYTCLQKMYDSLEMIQRKDILSKQPIIEEVCTIEICDQKRFDSLTAFVKEALKEGHKRICVKIKKGTYYFGDGHLKLVSQHYPDVSIIVEGKGVTLVPKGWTLKNDNDIPCEVSGESCYLDIKRKKSIPTWDEMMYADSLIEIIDIDTKRCRLKCEKLGDLSVSENNMTYINITRWCRCCQYKVIKIENGLVDFYAHDLALDDIFRKKEYNVNYDYIYAKANPRFRLCNVNNNVPIFVLNEIVHLASKYRTVHLGDATTFLVLQNSEFSHINIEGITFLGNKVSDLPLLYFKGAKAATIELTNCSFIGQKSRIVSLDATDNFYFHNNYVADNYEWGIVSLANSSNTFVENNYFENNGIGLSYSRCVACFGKDYYIGNNIFKNFGYCAISVGLPYGTIMDNPARGIIEYNHIYYDQEHFSKAWKYTIMDGGAIYVWTQNENCIIRYNYIHDYTGMRQNRGVYCDDGASGVKIYGNVVMGVPNWHAIDSRRVSGTEKANNKISFSERNNLNNVIMYNITDGTINFVGRDQEDNGCMKGGNIFLRSISGEGETRNFETTYGNLVVETVDNNIQYTKYDMRGVCIPEEGLNTIKALPCYSRINNYFREK